MRTCNNCGAEVADNAKFCRSCGAKLMDPEDVTVILDDGRQFYVTEPEGYKVEYECRKN